jgi:UDPglucose--hexose-1-phosphate uridylyltransferase
LTTSPIAASTLCAGPGCWSRPTAQSGHGCKTTDSPPRPLDSYQASGQQEVASKTTLPGYDPSCYLCPSNTRAEGAVNPEYDSTFVFVNDFSAVKEDQEAYQPNGGSGEDPSDVSVFPSHDLDPATRLLRAEAVTGKCYVVTFSPSHNLTLADMPPSQIVPIVETWTRIYAAHLSPTSPLAKTDPFVRYQAHRDISTPTQQYRYMQIFENKGAAMGCSNPHPHGQIWTVSGMPDEPGLELVQLQKYRKEHDGTHLLEDYVKLECRKQERVVFDNESFLVVCPWWATWPFETMIVSKSRKRALVDLSEQERLMLAEAIADITRRYDNLFETHFPYSK